MTTTEFIAGIVIAAIGSPVLIELGKLIWRTITRGEQVELSKDHELFDIRKSLQQELRETRLVVRELEQLEISLNKQMMEKDLKINELERELKMERQFSSDQDEEIKLLRVDKELLEAELRRRADEIQQINFLKDQYGE